MGYLNDDFKRFATPVAGGAFIPSIQSVIEQSGASVTLLKERGGSFYQVDFPEGDSVKIPKDAFMLKNILENYRSGTVDERVRRKMRVLEAKELPALEEAQMVLKDPVKELNALGKVLKRKIKAPLVYGSISTLGGAHRATLMLTVVLDEKDDWPNGIMENARYHRYSIDNEGIENFSGAGRPFMRKGKFKSFDDVARKINLHLTAYKKVYPDLESYSQQFRRGPGGRKFEESEKVFKGITDIAKNHKAKKMYPHPSGSIGFKTVHGYDWYTYYPDKKGFMQSGSTRGMDGAFETAVEESNRRTSSPITENKLHDAENAIRDMFYSGQYQGKVPDKDIKVILKPSSRWAKMYGKQNIAKAWKGLVDEEYVIKKGNVWLWAIYVEGAEPFLSPGVLSTVQKLKAVVSSNVMMEMLRMPPNKLVGYLSSLKDLVEAGEDVCKASEGLLAGSYLPEAKQSEWEVSFPNPKVSHHWKEVVPDGKPVKVKVTAASAKAAIHKAGKKFDLSPADARLFAVPEVKNLSESEGHLQETGEMSAASLKRGGEHYEWGLSLLKGAKEIGRSVRGFKANGQPRPFDVYQGPYLRVSTPEGPDTMWTVDDNAFGDPVFFIEDLRWTGTPDELAMAFSGDEDAVEDVENNTKRMESKRGSKQPSLTEGFSSFFFAGKKGSKKDIITAYADVRAGGGPDYRDALKTRILAITGPFMSSDEWWKTMVTALRAGDPSYNLFDADIVYDGLKKLPSKIKVAPGRESSAIMWIKSSDPAVLGRAQSIAKSRWKASEADIENDVLRVYWS